MPHLVDDTHATTTEDLLHLVATIDHTADKSVAGTQRPGLLQLASVVRAKPDARRESPLTLVALEILERTHDRVRGADLHRSDWLNR